MLAGQQLQQCTAHQSMSTSLLALPPALLACATSREVSLASERTCDSSSSHVLRWLVLQAILPGNGSGRFTAAHGVQANSCVNIL